ncbi:spondin-1-like [Galendromus occidentalis]|uniref:Spondin-1 n=1 Tax=Galendromus occidentalis TaxID=34638 RepID=A0AAJ7L4V8_9ACAR|nr:spondin-1-like [Galendromus occidentalis]
MLVVEASDPNRANTDAGAFQLFGDALSKFSEECPQAVMQASSVSKAEVTVLWTAPPAGAGCVIFKAFVVETAERWFMDDGDLTRELCPEEQDNEDEQPPLLDECCACDEAKYEMTFEGLWSRYTHPKGYPDNEWLTHFSDIIGASHAADFKMWEYEGFASEGVKSVAEHGATKKLEAELKAKSGKIRTIIKARGLWYPNVNGKTFAVFRVDRKHHVISVLSMLGPSPDWLVGVSSLELCLKNCSWLASKTMNLYPWDAGTSEGVRYVDEQRSPSVPQQRIRRITSSFPNHLDSPFYDPTGTPMKPVAKLTITRQRLYEKVACELEDAEQAVTEEKTPATVTQEESISVVETGNSNGGDECAVGEWSNFGPCSVSCGTGLKIRTRAYIHRDVALIAGCRAQIFDSSTCEHECASIVIPNGVSCETTPWSEWAECGVTCGKGVRTRRRKYKHHIARKVCSVELMEKEQCEAPVAHCAPENIEPNCAVTQWTDYSPCTASCGEGFRVRTRAYLNPKLAVISRCSVGQLQKTICRSEKVECADEERRAQEICFLPKDPGPCRGTFHYFYYDVQLGKCMKFMHGGCRGNKNRFRTFSECKKTCGRSLERKSWGGGMRDPAVPSIASPTTFPVMTTTDDDVLSEEATFYPPMTVTVVEEVVDCAVLRWSEWGECTKTCGYGRRERRRRIKTHPMNGGKPCPTKLVQRRRCRENPQCPPKKVHRS